MEKKVLKTSIIFYVFALISLIALVFFLFTTYQSVISFQSNGGSASVSDIISAYCSNCLPYLAYAIISYGIGYLIDKIANIQLVFSNLLEDEVADREKDGCNE